MTEILDFTFRPREDRRRASLLFFTLIGVSMIPLSLSVALDRYKGLISLVAVGFIVAALWVYMRYLVGEYAYVVMHADGTPMLVITKTVGRRVSTLYNILLSEIEGIEKLVRKEKRTKTPETGRAKHNFCPSLAPDICYAVTAGRDIIKIEGTDELAARLNEYAALARLAAYSENDGDE